MRDVHKSTDEYRLWWGNLQTSWRSWSRRSFMHRHLGRKATVREELDIRLEYWRISRTHEVKIRRRQCKGFAKPDGKLEKLVTQSIFQFFSAYKFDNVQNNRFRNPIRGRSSPKWAGYGGLMRNHHVLQLPGGDQILGVFSSNWKEFWAKVRVSFLPQFRLQALAVPWWATGRVWTLHRMGGISHTSTLSRVRLKLHSTHCFWCLSQNSHYHVSRAVILVWLPTSFTSAQRTFSTLSLAWGHPLWSTLWKTVWPTCGTRSPHKRWKRTLSSLYRARCFSFADGCGRILGHKDPNFGIELERFGTDSDI